MKNISACLSSNSIHWSTPKKLYDFFMGLGYVDPCPLNADFNGLEMIIRNGKYFINPPFKDLSIWADFIIKLINNDCNVWLLMPVRTDTKYFKKLLPFIIRIFFFDSRLHYNESKSAPFPSMLLQIKKNIEFLGDIGDYHTFYSVSIETFIEKYDFLV